MDSKYSVRFFYIDPSPDKFYCNILFLRLASVKALYTEVISLTYTYSGIAPIFSTSR